MSTIDFKLAKPPTEPRDHDLWLQHAAAFILMENVRNYALGQIASGASSEARHAAQQAIDDAMFGLMKVIDGENWLGGEGGEVDLRFVARLKDENEDVVRQLDLSDGDGFSMGFHEWVAGRFGDEPVAIPARPSS